MYQSYYPYMTSLVKCLQKIIDKQNLVGEEHMKDLEKIYKGLKKEINNVMDYMYLVDDNFVVPIIYKIVELYKKVIEFGKIFFSNESVANPLSEWLNCEKLYCDMKYDFHEFWKTQSKFDIPNGKGILIILL